jgi:DNA-directed RNA polymerase subunit RPC12/RpoP
MASPSVDPEDDISLEEAHGYLLKVVIYLRSHDQDSKEDLVTLYKILEVMGQNVKADRSSSDRLSADTSTKDAVNSDACGFATFRAVVKQELETVANVIVADVMMESERTVSGTDDVPEYDADTDDLASNQSLTFDDPPTPSRSSSSPTQVEDSGNIVKASRIRTSRGRPRRSRVRRQTSRRKYHKCTICRERFTAMDDLASHVTRDHPSEELRHSCPICDKEYTTQTEMYRHKKTHKSFTCITCEKTFATLGNLQTHRMTHTGLRPHACKICTKSFSLSHHLKSHMLTHTGDKPYVCSVCGRGFSQSSNLTTHMRTHTGKFKLHHLYTGR